MQMHSDTHTLTSDTEPTPMSEFTDCEELVMNNGKKEQNFKETRRTEYLLSITEAELLLLPNSTAPLHVLRLAGVAVADWGIH